MEKLRLGRLFCLGLLIAAAALLPLFTSPANAADGQSLREKRAEVSGMKRISDKRDGESVVLTRELPSLADYAPVPTGHWAYPALRHLSKQGLLNGYPDGFFKGDRPLTRYEFAQAMSNLLPMEQADSQAQLAVVALQTEFSGEPQRHRGAD